MKYSAENAGHFLSLLSQPEQAATRQGRDGGDHTLRLAASDALRDADRHEEADLLADPAQHVVVDGGVVKKGKWSLRHVDAAHDAVDNHLRRMTGGGYLADHGFGFTATGPADPTVGLDTEFDGSREMHVTQLPRELADHLDARSINDFGEWADGSQVPDRHWHTLDRLLDNLRNAPVDEPDEDA